MPTPFITVTDLGTDLGQDLSASAKATQDVAAACDIVRTITEQTINAVASESIKLDGTGTDALLLPQVPVTAVASVTEWTASASTVYAAEVDYKLNGNGVLLRMPTIVENGWTTSACVRGWTKGRQNFTVVYSHGYSTVPDDLKVVAIKIAARLFTQTGNVSYESLGQYSVRYESGGDMPTYEKVILRKYKQSR